MVQELEDKRVFINYGPIQMTLDIKVGSIRNTEIAFKVADYIIGELKNLMKYMPQLKELNSLKDLNDDYPEVLNKMITAVNRCGDETINVLGAVAGSFSDIALEKAIELGASRAIINNGGDIAFKDISGDQVKIGIPLSRDLSRNKLVMTITDDMDVRGICTSGLGGRSFTKGIATASVVLADNAAVADACATYLGNMTNVEDERITRCFAEDIDSGTDIPGQMVTLSVGNISKDKIYQALLNGANAAEKLYERGIIKGALLCVKNEIVMIPDSISYIEHKK